MAPEQRLETFTKVVAEELDKSEKAIHRILPLHWPGVVQMGVRPWAVEATKSQSHETCCAIRTVFDTLQKWERGSPFEKVAPASDELAYYLRAGQDNPAEHETQRIVESLLRSVAAAALVAADYSSDAILEWLPKLLNPSGRISNIPSFDSQRVLTGGSTAAICRWLSELSTSEDAIDELKLAAAVSRYLVERQTRQTNHHRTATVPVLFDYTPVLNRGVPWDSVASLTLTATTGFGRLIPDPEMLLAFDPTWLSGFEKIWQTVNNDLFPDRDVFWRLKTTRFVEVVSGKSAQVAFRSAIRCLHEDRPWPRKLIATGELRNKSIVKVAGVLSPDAALGGKLVAVGDQSIPYQIVAVPSENYDELPELLRVYWTRTTEKQLRSCGTLDDLFELADELVNQESKQLNVLISLPHHLRNTHYEASLRTIFDQQRDRFLSLTDIQLEFSSSPEGRDRAQDFDLVLGVASDSLGAREAVPSRFYEHPDYNQSIAAGQGLSGNSVEVCEVPVRSGLEIDLLTAIAGAATDESSLVVFVHHERDFDLNKLNPGERMILVESLNAITAFRLQLYDHEHDGVCTYSIKGDETEFRLSLENFLQSRIKILLQRKGFSPKSVRDARPAATWNGNPFRGLARFEFEHSEIFRGRQSQINELCRRFRRLATAVASGETDTATMVMIYGPSGVGKSSLVRAGLIPLIVNKPDFKGSGVGRPAAIRHALVSLDEIPSKVSSLEIDEDWEMTVAKVFANALDADKKENTLGMLMESVAFPTLSPGTDNSESLRIDAGARRIVESPSEAAACVIKYLYTLEAIAACSKPDSTFCQLVLCVDQFDELLANERTNASVSILTFLETLARSGDVWIVGTLQSTAVDRLADTNLKQVARGDSLFRLESPSLGDWIEIVEGAGDAAGLVFEVRDSDGSSLADTIIREAHDSPDCLPLLEYALHQLYEEDVEKLSSSENEGEKSPILTFATYERLQGVGGALEKTARMLDATLAPSTLAESSRLFSYLIRFDFNDHRPGVRTAYLDEANISPELAQFLKSAASARLLTIHRASETSQTVRLTHQRLLDSWPLLRSWIEEHRELLPIRERIETAAVLWNEASHPQDLLLPTGRQLDDGLHLLKSGFSVSSTTREFIDQSNRSSLEKRRENIRLSLSIAEGKLQSLGMASNIEVRNDHLMRALTLANIAKQAAVTHHAELMHQMELLSASVESDERLALDDTWAISPWLNRDTWEQLEVHLLRQFPFVEWTREIQQTVKKAIIAPTDDLIALILQPGVGGETVIVWEIERNVPTECIIRSEIGGEDLHICWSPDGKHLYVFANEMVNNQISNQTTIFTYDAKSGYATGASTSLTGVVHTVGCSADGSRLFVINKIDGSMIDYAAMLHMTQSIFHKSGDDTTEGGFIGGMLDLFSLESPTTATMYILNAYDLSEIDSHQFDGPIIDASHGDNTVAVVCMEKPDWRWTEYVASDTERLRVSPIEKPNKISNKNSLIRVSQDGRYLVTKKSGRGLSLYECLPELREVTAFGSGSLYTQVLLTSLESVVSIITVESATEHGVAPGRGAESSGTISEYQIPIRRSNVEDSSVAISQGNSIKVTPTLVVQTRDLIKSIARHPKRGMVALGTSNGSVRVWQNIFDVPKTPVLDIPGGCRIIQFVGETRLLTASTDGQLRLWNLTKNSLGEQVSQNEVSTLSPHYLLNTPWQDSTFGFAPNAKYGISVVRVEDRRFSVVLCHPSLFPIEISRELGAVASRSQVSFSRDSNYAAICSGQIQSRSGGVSPLLDHGIMQMGGAPDISERFPESSSVALFDALTEEFTADIWVNDGPLVNAHFRKSDDAELLIGGYDRTTNKGQIVTVDLKTRVASVSAFGDSIIPFANLSASDDHLAVVTISRFGEPFLYCRGAQRPNAILDYFEGSGRSRNAAVFSDVRISGCGRFVLLASASGETQIFVLDLSLKNVTEISIKSSSFSPIVRPVCGSSNFIIASGTGEFLIIDSLGGIAAYREDFGDRCVSATVDSNGTRSAVVTASGVVRIRSIPDGRIEVPDLPIPITNGIRLDPENNGCFNLSFFDSGDLVVGDFPLLKLRMSPAESSKAVEAAIAALSNKTEVRIFAGGQAESVSTTGLDWFDKYSVSRKSLLQMQRPIIDILKSVDFSEIPSPAYRQDFAYQLLVFGSRERDVAACLTALEFLLSSENEAELSEEHQRLAFSVLVQTSPEGALAQLRNFKPNTESLTASVFDLYEARCLVALGDFANAVSRYRSAMMAPTFIQFEKIRPHHTTPIRLEQAFTLILSGSSDEDTLSSFANILHARDLSVVAARCWVQFIMGLRIPVDIDYEAGAPLGNQAMEMFVHFYRRYCANELVEAARLADRLEPEVPEVYRFDTARPAFPMNRSHVCLIHSELAATLGDLESALARLNEAEGHWASWETSAVSIGIDRTAVWPWRIPFDVLRGRVLKIVSNLGKTS